MSTTWLRRLPTVILPMICAIASTLTAQSISWSFVGRHEGGNIRKLYTIGQNDILAQTDGMALYRSTDAGGSWHQFLPDSLSSANFLGGGNGHPLFVYRYPGNFRSTDGGASWTLMTAAIAGRAIYPTPGGALFSGVDGVIWRSLDEGVTWSRAAFLQIERDASFAAAPDGSIYAAFFHLPQFSTSGDPVTLWRSTDTGATWVPVVTDYLPADATSLAIAPSGTMFIGTETSGVFRSTDNGVNWKRIIQCDYTRGLSVNSSQVIVADMRNVYISSDDGATWSEQSCVSTTLTDGIAVGSSVLVGTLGRGVLKLGASSEPERMNKGLDALGIGAIWVRADGSLMSNAGGVVYRSTDGGDHWTELDADRGRAELSRVTTGGAMLIPSPEGKGILRSVDGGASWSQVYYSMMSVGAIVEGKDHDAYALVMPDRLIKSTDDGATWVNFAFTQPTTDYQPNHIFVDGDRLLVGTQSGSVIEFSIATGVRLGAWMVNPRGVSEVFRGPSGSLFARSVLGGISRSTDDGITWEMAQPPVNPDNREFGQVSFGPGGRMVAAMDVGIFFSSDEGRSWHLETKGLPPLSTVTNEGPLYSVAFGLDGTVYAAGGSGLYRGMMPTGAAVAADVAADELSIAAVRPNPASGSASLRLRLGRDARVSVRLLDPLGRDVIGMRSLRLGAGTHDLPLDLSGLNAGAYFCTVDVDGVRKTVPLSIVR